MPGIARMHSVVLDCADPMALAEFYRALVGGEITQTEPDWVDLRAADVALSFQLAPDHQPPQWPDPARPQQLHIDVTVDDIDEAEPRVLAAGATRLEAQPREANDWRVYLDPAGHPFCLCWD